MTKLISGGPLRLAVGAAFLAMSATAANAVPTLQVGVSDGAGGYLPYFSNSTDPTENDTAITSGFSLVVGGAYGPNDLLIGGQYAGGRDYSSMKYSGNNLLPSIFDDRGAVLMATTSDTTGTLQFGSLTPFLTTTDLYFPNNHAPLQEPGVQYMYFDIGNFAKIANAVPDFASPAGTPAAGEVKSLAFTTSGFEWIHFDLMALVTSPQGQTALRTTLDNNPGSHDVTWQDDGSGTPNEIPEPTSMALVGLGLFGLGWARRRKPARNRSAVQCGLALAHP